MVVIKTNNLGKRNVTFLCYSKWRVLYIWRSFKKTSIVCCSITQRTCLLSLEKWPHLEIFQHKTILVACKKKFNSLSTTLNVTKWLQYKCLQKKKTKTKNTQKKTWNNTSLSEKQTSEEFFVQCILFSSLEDKKHILKSITRTWLTLFFLHV